MLAPFLLRVIEQYFGVQVTIVFLQYMHFDTAIPT